MNKTSLWGAVLGGSLAALVLAGMAQGAVAGDGSPTAVQEGRTEQAGDKAILDLLEEDLVSQRRADPVGASTRGDRRFDALLPDVSPEGVHAWVDDAAGRLERARAVDPESLSPMRQTERAMLVDALKTRLLSVRFRSWEMAVTQLNGPQYELPQMPQSLTFTSEKQLEDYVARLEKVAGYIEQTTVVLRAGAARGFTPPRMVMGTAAAQALSHGTEAIGGDATKHALYSPFAGRSGPLADRAKKVILEQVAPAYDRFGAFLRDEYVPKCRETLAAKDLPDGKAYYEFRVKAESTLDFDADAIHRIGLEEVARIKGGMMGVIARSDFKPEAGISGDGAVFAAFVKYLRTDPRFYAKSGAELIERYRAAGKIIDAELPRLFVQMPTLPWGVREMPRFIAASSPTAYYYQGSIANGQAGFFVANTHLLDQRPLYDVFPLTLHEAVPGHHFQVALSQELKEVPEWRTTTMYTGFVEGWGLYAEKLGLEMGDDARSATNPDGHGLFTDPYDDFGRLNFEMWRALRLVVDTGIHAQGWTRDRAIAFMEENSALSRNNIEREVDRYIAWPGQAVAYKLGEMHILNLRAEAEKRLGSRFDVRGFHRAVLGRGAVPLKVLSEQVGEWVEGVERAK
jgi:uncharacterized protein (DUF885 family)